MSCLVNFDIFFCHYKLGCELVVNYVSLVLFLSTNLGCDCFTSKHAGDWVVHIVCLVHVVGSCYSSFWLSENRWAIWFSLLCRVMILDVVMYLIVCNGVSNFCSFYRCFWVLISGKCDSLDWAHGAGWCAVKDGRMGVNAACKEWKNGDRCCMCFIISFNRMWPYICYFWFGH